MKEIPAHMLLIKFKNAHVVDIEYHFSMKIKKNFLIFHKLKNQIILYYFILYKVSMIFKRLIIQSNEITMLFD